MKGYGSVRQLLDSQVLVLDHSTNFLPVEQIRMQPGAGVTNAKKLLPKSF